MGRIRREKLVVEKMIRLYCRKNYGHRKEGVMVDGLCEGCRELLEYAHKRLEYCKFGEGKASCQKCPVHCYKPEMRERIRVVMRFSGPRMILHHPIVAIRHLIEK